MFIVTIMNSVYFVDIYNDGSENLSTSQSKQLIVLNIVTCLLLFIGIFLIIYMLMLPSVSDMKTKELVMITDKKQIEFEEKLDEFKDINDEIEKKKETRDQITRIVSSIDNSRKVAATENKTLKKKVTKLSTELEDLKENYGDLYDEHGNLIKTNEQLEVELRKHKQIIDEMDKNIKLKERLEEARKDKPSVIMEGSSEIDTVENSIESVLKDPIDYRESLFGKDHKISTVPIPNLFPDDASLDEILDELPRSSIITDDHKEQNYDYGLNIKPEQDTSIPKYESFNYTKRTDPQIAEAQQRTFFTPKPFVKLSDDKSVVTPKYTPYYPSFLSQMFGK